MSSHGEHRYVVIGAGAIGGTVGGVLARAGVPAALVARGKHAEVLATEGLTMHTPDGTFHTPVDTAFRPEDLRLTDRDVLVFATKTQQLDAALHQWVDRPVNRSDGTTAAAGECLPVLTALNGVVAEEKALRYFRRVFGVCVWCPAAHMQSGEVIVRTWPVVGQFHMPAGPRPSARRTTPRSWRRWPRRGTPPASTFADPTTSDRGSTTSCLVNLTNAVRALSFEDASHVGTAVMSEGVDVLRDAGIEFVPFETSTAARSDGPTPRPVPGAAGAPGDSTSQSLRRNTGNVETDYLNGEIVRIAHRIGRSAPINAALTHAARAAARDGVGPGQFSAAQLAELVGLDPAEAK